MNEPPRTWTWNGQTHTETLRLWGKCDSCQRKLSTKLFKKGVDDKGGIRYSTKRLRWECVQCVLRNY